jgi:hypothetical protein
MTRLPHIIKNNIDNRLHNLIYSAVTYALQGRAQLVVEFPLPTVVPLLIRMWNVDADDLIVRLPEEDRLTKTGAQP